eukprot:CAMPEP_0181308170 /NCGR_PEP_ID=MMETSP1101-20121128/11306_1 /TAXON_ID=46948 /ORGANISM="Rhodomonas abbreviata, Strain Caron Lab Isolate" /LENGTH=215 /DNA_ID=CAMNT_0023414507 /DNA_START=290 /DNA_END=934 /DNA_ORIENTATION=-
MQTPQAIGSMPMLPMNQQSGVQLPNGEAGSTDAFTRLGSFGTGINRLESVAPDSNLDIFRVDSVAAQNMAFGRLSSDPHGFNRVSSTPFSNNLDRLASAFPGPFNAGFFDRTQSTLTAMDAATPLAAAGFGRLGSLSSSTNMAPVSGADGGLQPTMSAAGDTLLKQGQNIFLSGSMAQQPASGAQADKQNGQPQNQITMQNQQNVQQQQQQQQQQ